MTWKAWDDGMFVFACLLFFFLKLHIWHLALWIKAEHNLRIRHALLALPGSKKAGRLERVRLPGCHQLWD